MLMNFSRLDQIVNGKDLLKHMINGKILFNFCILAKELHNQYESNQFGM